MNKSTMLAVALAFTGIWVLTVIAVAGTTEGMRAVALATIAMAIVASLLALYFSWRAKLQRRVLAEGDDRQSQNADNSRAP